ncbi:Cleavage inducible protein, partial [Phytophthora megakarya]
VGGSRISRLRKAIESVIDNLHTRRSVGKPSHAFEDSVIDDFKEHCATWVLEDAFLCSHRLPRRYFTEPNITWKAVHDRYVDETTRPKPGARTMSYSRFTQYLRYYFLGVRLTRTTVDVCDCCVCLKIQLQQPDLTEDERNVLLLEQSPNLDSAIAQRRFISNQHIYLYFTVQQMTTRTSKEKQAQTQGKPAINIAFLFGNSDNSSDKPNA